MARQVDLYLRSKAPVAGDFSGCCARTILKALRSSTALRSFSLPSPHRLGTGAQENLSCKYSLEFSLEKITSVFLRGRRDRTRQTSEKKGTNLDVNLLHEHLHLESKHCGNAAELEVWSTPKFSTNQNEGKCKGLYGKLRVWEHASLPQLLHRTSETHLCCPLLWQRAQTTRSVERFSLLPFRTAHANMNCLSGDGLLDCSIQSLSPQLYSAAFLARN